LGPKALWLVFMAALAVEPLHARVSADVYFRGSSIASAAYSISLNSVYAPVSRDQSALASDTLSSRVTRRHIRARQPALYEYAAVNRRLAAAPEIECEANLFAAI
jgi:hypothetical protein